MEKVASTADACAERVDDADDLGARRRCNQSEATRARLCVELATLQVPRTARASTRSGVS